MHKSIIEKCENRLFRCLGLIVVFGIVLTIGLYGMHESAARESVVSEHQRAKTNTVAYRTEKSCKGWDDQHSCKNPCIEGSVYCAEHAHCSYEGCGEKLSEDEMVYCSKHASVVLAEWYKRYQKREEERTGTKEETKSTEDSGRSNTNRKKHSTYSAGTYDSRSHSSGSYKSYDSGYDDVYDGDYDDQRYKTDLEYANGVDDAIDELGDDW